MHSAETDAATVISFAIFIAAWSFVIMYQIYSRGSWRRDPMGRHIMAFVAVDGVVFTFLVLAYLFPVLAIDTWYIWSYLVSIAGIFWVISWRIWILYRLHRRARKEKDREEVQQ